MSELFIDNPTAAAQAREHLGWILVHSLWQFAAIGILVAAVMQMLRHSSSNVRYIVLVAAMGVTVGVPPTTWWLTPTRTPDDGDPMAIEQNDAFAILDRDASEPGIEMSLDPAVAQAHIAQSAENALSLPLDSSSNRRDVILPPAQSMRDRVTDVLRPWLAWIVGCWCIGVLTCSLRPLMGWRTLRRLQTIGISPPSADVLAAFNRVCRQLGLNGAVQVFQSTLAHGPMVVGYFRPAVLLPVSLVTNMPVPQLEAILAHELAHVRRHDFIVNVLQTVIETLFFYHPVIWWLSHRVRVEREHCCDDLVIRHFDNGPDYGRALIAVEQLQSRAGLFALGVTDGSLLARIRRIARRGLTPESNRLRDCAMLGVLCLASLGIALPFAFGMLNQDGRQPVASQADAFTESLIVYEWVAVVGENLLDELRNLEESPGEVLAIDDRETHRWSADAVRAVLQSHGRPGDVTLPERLAVLPPTDESFRSIGVAHSGGFTGFVRLDDQPDSPPTSIMSSLAGTYFLSVRENRASLRINYSRVSFSAGHVRSARKPLQFETTLRPDEAIVTFVNPDKQSGNWHPALMVVQEAIQVPHEQHAAFAELRGLDEWIRTGKAGRADQVARILDWEHRGQEALSKVDANWTKSVGEHNGRIQLVSLSRPGAAPGIAWTPDGQPIECDHPHATDRNDSLLTLVRVWEPGTKRLTVSDDDAAETPESPGGQFAYLRWDPSIDWSILRVGAGFGPWTAEVRLDPTQGSTVSIDGLTYELKQWNGNGGDRTLAFILPVPNDSEKIDSKNIDLSMVAVDKSGKVHNSEIDRVYHGPNASHGGGYWFDLREEDIDHLVVRTRPVQWVEFTDIELSPADALNPPLEFAAVSGAQVLDRATDAATGPVIVAPPLEMRFAANPPDSKWTPRIPKDLAELHYPDQTVAGQQAAKDSGFRWIRVADPKDGTVSLPLEGVGPNLRLALLADTPDHALLWDGTWSFKSCEAIADPNLDGNYSISMKLDAAGGHALRRLTRTHLMQPLAIVVNGKIISAPVVHAEIGGDLMIAGRFNKAAATALVNAILSAKFPLNPSAENGAGDRPADGGNRPTQQPSDAAEQRPTDRTDTSAVTAGPVKATAADSASHFSGGVIDPDGQPFVGASIYLVSNKGDATTLGAVRATSDANGRFEFDAPDLTYSGYDGLPKRREGLIFAMADGFAPDWMETWGNNTSTFREYWTPREGAEIELQLAADDLPINGQFLDAAGRPLVGARVRLTQLMVAGKGSLTAHLEHWSKASVMAGFLTKVPSYKRELTRTALIPNLTIDTLTDADGRFTLKGFGRDRLARLTVTAPNVMTTGIEVMARDAPNVGMFLNRDGKPTQTVYGATFSLQLERGLTVHGIVRDRDTKAPVAGMWIAKRYNPLTYAPARDGAPVTDENGRFELTGLDPKLLTYEAKYRRFTAIPQPGVLYLQSRSPIEPAASVSAAADSKDNLSSAVKAKLDIECVRGITYRLKVVDEDGQPVEGEVEYRPISPNPPSRDLILSQMTDTNWPVMNRAALRPDGTYEGFVLPGPGAIIVELPDRRAWRPSFVDPKAFFEPGRTEWTPENEQFYGTSGTLKLFGVVHDQTNSNAIVLVNPPAGSEPLELTATVYRDRPRQVSLVDPAGKPVRDVVSLMHWPTRVSKEKLNTATFSIRGLDPQRVKQMIFIQEDRRLVGILLARGDGDSPYTVTLQPWCTLAGRVLDSDNQPLAKQTVIVRATDEGVDKYYAGKSDEDGQFRVDQVIPDLTYRIEGKVRQPGFVAVDDQPIPLLDLRPGETRDIGDVRIRQ